MPNVFPDSASTKSNKPLRIRYDQFTLSGPAGFVETALARDTRRRHERFAGAADQHKGESE
jgi:hypothetical protein